MHKNASLIYFNSGKTTYIFDRLTGRRLHKCHDSSTQHWVFYNPVNKKFHKGDCACYSYNYNFSVNGYDPEDQAVAAKATELPIPIVLDEVKQSIKEQLAKNNQEESKGEAEANAEAEGE